MKEVFHMSINLLKPKGEILEGVSYYSEYSGGKQWPYSYVILWDSLKNEPVYGPNGKVWTELC